MGRIEIERKESTTETKFYGIQITYISEMIICVN